jgi:3-isopropylmalate/(R)-2-methylmalate dehydratase large subunit
MQPPRTLFDKLWDMHAIAREPDGDTLLWVDRHYVHEGSHHAFARIAARGRSVARPDLTFAFADHYVPTRSRAGIAAIPDATTRGMVEKLVRNTTEHAVTLFGLDDPRQGIVHVVGPEQGLTLPGLLVVCGDSHTATHGALGAYAFGIGASEVAHVLATQTIWQRKPKRMRLSIDGILPPGLTAKDLILHVIATIRADGAQGYAIEYAGSAIRALTMEGRLTLSNMSIEAGARTGLIAPDETTIAYIAGRPFAPKGSAFERAAHDWQALATDNDAQFDRDVTIDVSRIEPTLTWGTSPQDATAISGRTPDPAAAANPARAAEVRDALSYMGLVPDQPLAGIPIDFAFIGSCTNARIEDLRAAAAVLAGRTARVPALVSPGSSDVKAQAEQEGLDRIFTAAGFEWAASGCSMCVGMNGDIPPPGARCASSTNRNFKGRQGPRVRTHLMSPAMVAAAAVTGTLTDCRPLLEGRA